MEERPKTTKQPAVPRFGAVLDRAVSFVRYELDMEMYHLHRAHHHRCQEVRILHASTYLPGAQPEVCKIIEYMNGKGFVLKHMRHWGRVFNPECFTADVLLLGCDSKQVENIKEAMDEMERGLHGVFRERDVLWYFADGHVSRRARRHMGGSGLCSNDSFSAEGIRMMSSHIRRRHDITAQRGLYITLEQWITDGIDRIVPANSKWDTFGRKVDRLKKRVGTGGRDRDLFFAVTEFLMEMRNRSSHPNVDSSFDRPMDSYNHLKDVVHQHEFDLRAFTIHGCPMEQDGEPDHQGRHVLRRTCVALARMARAWLEEYATLLKKSG